MKELEYLLKEYRDRMDMLIEALARNNVGNMEDYRYICGQLRGLEAACAIIADLKRDQEVDFDE